MKKVRMSLTMPEPIHRALVELKKKNLLSTSLTQLVLEAVVKQYGLGEER